MIHYEYINGNIENKRKEFLETLISNKIKFIECNCFEQDRFLDTKDYIHFMGTLFFLFSKSRTYADNDYLFCKKFGISMKTTYYDNIERLYFFIFNHRDNTSEYFVALQGSFYSNSNSFTSLEPFFAFRADNIVKDNGMATKFFILDKNGDYYFSIRNVSKKMSDFIRHVFNGLHDSYKDFVM